MIVYKWVIEKNNKFFPIINNGAFKLFNKLNLGYYTLGKTYKNFINPYLLLKDSYIHTKRQRSFHRTGYHFWIKKNNNEELKRYNLCMKRQTGKRINCILTCYIRNKDIIKISNNRVIAKKFRILKKEYI